jgi:hypothetical protein
MGKYDEELDKRLSELSDYYGISFDEVEDCDLNLKLDMLLSEIVYSDLDQALPSVEDSVKIDRILTYQSILMNQNFMTLKLLNDIKNELKNK